VTANILLAHPPDSRSYDLAVLILQDLGITQCRLMTNNPDKVGALTLKTSASASNANTAAATSTTITSTEIKSSNGIVSSFNPLIQSGIEVVERVPMVPKGWHNTHSHHHSHPSTSIHSQPRSTSTPPTYSNEKMNESILSRNGMTNLLDPSASTSILSPIPIFPPSSSTSSTSTSTSNTTSTTTTSNSTSTALSTLYSMQHSTQTNEDSNHHDMNDIPNGDVDNNNILILHENGHEINPQQQQQYNMVENHEEEFHGLTEMDEYILTKIERMNHMIDIPERMKQRLGRKNIK